MKRFLDILAFIFGFFLVAALVLQWAPAANASKISFEWDYPVEGDSDYNNTVTGFDIFRYDQPGRTNQENVIPQIPIEAREASMITEENDLCFSYWITASSPEGMSGPSNKIVVCNNEGNITISFIEERK